MVPLVHTARELAEFLASRHPLEGQELAALRRSVDERPLPYPLGVGQGDVIAVAAGIKPMLRQTLAREQAAAAVRRYAHLGLAAYVVTESAEARVRHGAALLYLGRDPGRIREAARAEAAQDDDALGWLLGYPRCCVEAFLAVPQPRTNAAAVSTNFVGPRRVAPGWINCVDLQVFNYVSWVPCGPWCSLSLRYAGAVREHIASPLAQFVTQGRGEGGFPYFVEAIDVALAAHRLHVFPGVQLSLLGNFKDGVVAVTQVWATARDRHPESPVDAHEAESTARLLRLVRVGVRVQVQGQAVLIDGAPVLRAPQPFVVAFEVVSRGTRA